MVGDATEMAGDGCDVWKACLTCPLPACLAELSGAEQLRIKQRAKEIRLTGRIRTLAAQGKRARQVAAALGVCQTEVYRIARVTGITFHGDAGARRRGRACAGDGLTPELRARTAARYVAGERVVDLAQAVGVSTTTVHAWVRAARALTRREMGVMGDGHTR